MRSHFTTLDLIVLVTSKGRGAPGTQPPMTTVQPRTFHSVINPALT